MGLHYSCNGCYSRKDTNQMASAYFSAFYLSVIILNLVKVQWPVAFINVHHRLGVLSFIESFLTIK